MRGAAPDRESAWFRIDGIHAELGARSARSGLLAVMARVAQGLLGIGSTMILARVLRPADFGVLAMVLPLTFLYNSIANAGVQAAVMHAEMLDHGRASAFFRSAALTNLLLAALFAACGPFLARFYDDPRATGVAIAWAAVLWFATLSAVHEALLKRQLRFASVLTVRTAAFAFGVLAAVTAAWLGAGYWALLIQWVTLDVFRTFAIWWLSRWRPAWRGSAEEREAAGGMLRYWRSLAGYQVLSWFAVHPDRILVGKLGGATLLGFYDSGRRWAFYPAVELFQSVSDVAIATFSRLVSDAGRYRAFLLRGMIPMLALPLPMIAYIFADTRNVILVLLGPQWLEATPFVRLMCVAAFFGSLARITNWFYLSRGETGRQLRWALFAQTPGMLAAVLLGARWGALGVAAGFTIATSALAIPAVFYCLRGTPVRPRDFARAAARPVLGAAGAAALLLLTTCLLPHTGVAPLDMGLRLALFLAFYGFAWLASPGGRREAVEAIAMLQELRGRPGPPA